jgi:AraC-like DNA-binding protein
MIYTVKTDLIPLFRHLVESLQPFAQANFVELKFQCQLDSLVVNHHPFHVLPGLCKLICKIIAYTPQDYHVHVLVPRQTQDEDIVEMTIRNSGVFLGYWSKESFEEYSFFLDYSHAEENGTIFQIDIPVDSRALSGGGAGTEGGLSSPVKKRKIPPLFSQLNSHLQSYFSNIGNLETAAESIGPRNAMFLKKVNAVILTNLDNESLDTDFLSRAMALSRSQLYRKLKPLTTRSPAHYIRYVRLQKARELLEQTDHTVGNIAFETGFINQSHFSRVFREQYGFNPSDLRNDKK